MKYLPLGRPGSIVTLQPRNENLVGGRWVAHTEDLRRAVRDAVRVVPPRARVLAVIPDRTRDDNTDLLFPLLSQELAARGAGQFDALIAQGTHPAMSDAEKRVKIGAGLADTPLVGTIFDHHWDRPSELVTLGTLSRGEVSRSACSSAMPSLSTVIG